MRDAPRRQSPGLIVDSSELNCHRSRIVPRQEFSMRRWVFRWVRALGIAVVVAAVAIWLLTYWPRGIPPPPLRLAQGTLAIEHARIYTSPNDPPIPDGTVLIVDGRIAAVGPNAVVPPGATVTILPCDHCVVTAGFWNAHVHFTEPKWGMSEGHPASKLIPQLADRLVSRGFTQVVDTGSFPIDTLA